MRTRTNHTMFVSLEPTSRMSNSGSAVTSWFWSTILTHLYCRNCQDCCSNQPIGWFHTIANSYPGHLLTPSDVLRRGTKRRTCLYFPTENAPRMHLFKFPRYRSWCSNWAPSVYSTCHVVPITLSQLEISAWDFYWHTLSVFGIHLSENFVRFIT